MIPNVARATIPLLHPRLTLTVVHMAGEILQHCCIVLRVIACDPSNLSLLYQYASEEYERNIILILCIIPSLFAILYRARPRQAPL